MTDKKRNRHDLTSAERKQMPVHRGCFKYFPDALMAVAMLSMRADRKHTPNADPNDMSRPQWVKDASADHGDCVGRHQLDVGIQDEQMGLDFMVSVGWRALAQLQAHIDEHGLDSIIDWDWEPPFAGVTDAETARELAAQIVEAREDAETARFFEPALGYECAADADASISHADCVCRGADPRLEGEPDSSNPRAVLCSCWATCEPVEPQND